MAGPRSKRRTGENSSQHDERTGKRSRRSRAEGSPLQSATSTPPSLQSAGAVPVDEDAIMGSAHEGLATSDPGASASSPPTPNIMMNSLLLGLPPELDGASGTPYDTCFGMVGVEFHELISC